MRKSILFLFCLALGLILLQGCAGKKSSPAANTAPEAASVDGTTDEFIEEETKPQPDSMQGFNRRVFTFNDGFITYVVSPFDAVYTGLFPQDFRNGFGNFYRNLGYPVRLVNSLLQFRLDKVGKETASFVLNTVLGFGGLFNVTRDTPALQCTPEDFGQTLAFYGLGHGSYLVLPLLGPSSLRDTVGLVADSFLNPVTYVTPDGARYALTAHDKANAASANLPTYKTIKAESFDHYTSMKDVYFQYRNSLEAE